MNFSGMLARYMVEIISLDHDSEDRFRCFSDRAGARRYANKQRTQAQGFELAITYSIRISGKLHQLEIIPADPNRKRKKRR